MYDPADGPLHLLLDEKEIPPDLFQVRERPVVELVFFRQRGGEGPADLVEPVHAGVRVGERGIVVLEASEVAHDGAGRRGEIPDECQFIELQYAAFLRQCKERPDVGYAGEVRGFMLEGYFLELGNLSHPGPDAGGIEGRHRFDTVSAHRCAASLLELLPDRGPFEYVQDPR